jgi:hypothetical protein
VFLFFFTKKKVFGVLTEGATGLVGGIFGGVDDIGLEVSMLAVDMDAVEIKGELLN